MRFPQEFAAKSLRGLGQPQSFPRQGCLDDGVLHTLDRLTYGPATGGGAGHPRGGEHTLDQIRGDEGPDRVVHDDPSRVGRRRLQSLADGILALGPAGDHLKHPRHAEAPEQLAGGRDSVGRSGDDEPVQRRTPGERAQGEHENGRTAHRQVLLGLAHSHARARAARRHHRDRLRHRGLVSLRSAHVIAAFPRLP